MKENIDDVLHCFEGWLSKLEMNCLKGEICKLFDELEKEILSKGIQPSSKCSYKSYKRCRDLIRKKILKIKGGQNESECGYDK